MIFNLKCNNCGKEFERHKSSGYKIPTKTFCCTNCQFEYYRNNKDFCNYSNRRDYKSQLKGTFKNCPNCGKEYYDLDGKKLTCCRKCSNEWIKKTGYKKNKLSPQYRGLNWNEQRNKCLERFNTCQICGSNHKLDVHHIILQRYFNNVEESNFDNNLITFCHSCHIKLHRYMQLNDCHIKENPQIEIQKLIKTILIQD